MYAIYVDVLYKYTLDLIRWDRAISIKIKVKTKSTEYLKKKYINICTRIFYLL